MDEFMELIKQVTGLANALKIKHEKENAREKVNTGKAEELSGRETTISETETDLKQRESKIQGIESVVQLKQDAVELRKKAEKEMADTIARKEENALADKAAKAVNATEKSRIGQANTKLADDVKLLARGWDELRAKEKTYKAEINAKLSGLKI